MRRTWLLLLLAAGLVALPLVLDHAGGGGGSFTGADGQARDAAQAGAPDYRPWIAPLWTPPSAEVEGLLFAVQAALGAGVLGYALGFLRGRRQGRQEGQREEVGTHHAGD